MHCASVHRPAGHWPKEKAARALALDCDARHCRRCRLTTDQREDVLLDLPQAVAMADGDGLQLEDGRWPSRGNMNDLTDAFLLTYAGLFPVVNPVGGAPIFLGLTPRCTAPERHALARRVAVNSFFLLLGSLFAGSYVLELFGITLPVVRIGGGMAVIALAWKLLNGDELTSDQRAAGDTGRAVPPTDAFYPLTMPLTVGPGSIAVAITLGSQRPKAETSLEQLAPLGGAAVVGILAIAITIYACYRFAERIVAALGASGTTVLVRLSAFILLCIGIQIVWNGYSALVGITTP